MSESDKQTFWGKYRGTVLNNVDPEVRGRIQAIVPDVSSLLPTTFALPCVPYGGIQSGQFAVPMIGSAVWIEFEHGDPDYPIWSGCFWGSPAEVPAAALVPPPPVPSITFQTSPLTALHICDLPGPTGGIMLRAGTASITVAADGIYIQNGAGASIVMAGPSVTVNLGALVVI